MNRWLAWRGHRWTALACRLYIGVVFLLASYHKILHPESFAVDVATYQFLPLWSVNAFALLLPWVEALAGILLVVGVRVHGASLLVALMMVSFMVALAWALHLHLDMSCGCFASQGAVDDDPISWHTLVRDSVWLIQSVYVLLLDREPIGLERLLRRRTAQDAQTPVGKPS